MKNDDRIQENYCICQGLRQNLDEHYPEYVLVRWFDVKMIISIAGPDFFQEFQKMEELRISNQSRKHSFMLLVYSVDLTDLINFALCPYFPFLLTILNRTVEHN